MSGVDLVVAPCSYKAARYACQKYHYSKTIPANKSNYFGVWENGAFVGAIIFGLGASPSLGKPYGLGVFEVCELTRVALSQHKANVTQSISKAIKQIKQANSGLRLVVSFADAFHNHHGGIYQAGNWIYTGVTSSSTMIQLPDGSMADPRRFNGHGHNTAKKIPTGAKFIKTPPKHRYLYPLDKAMRRQIEPLAQPYPKRADVGEMESRVGSTD